MIFGMFLDYLLLYLYKKKQNLIMQVLFSCSF